MDTINEEAPQEASDVTAASGHAEPDTQTVETSETFDGGNGAEAGEALLAGKYKSQEELIKGYTELEGKLGELGQKAKVADVLQQKYGLNAEQLQAQIEQIDYHEKLQRYADNPLAPVLDEVAELRSIVQQQAQEKALNATKAEVNDFIKSNPAFEAHKEQILKLTLTPGIGYDPQTGSETPISDIANDYFGTARAQGQQDAYNKIETKQMTQATDTRSTPRKQFTADDLKSMSSAEIEALYGFTG